MSTLARTGEIGAAVSRWAAAVVASNDRGAGAAQLRESFERLGPVFVKLGQLLSTRPDLLPPVYLRELERLQCRVAPMSADDVDQALRAHADALGGSPFASFDREPLAAASLAQVHRARLHDGTDVAVKLRRPGLVERVAVDLRVLGLAARAAQRLLRRSEVYDFPGVVEELGQALEEELDLRNEAESLAVFARNLAPWAPLLRVPRAFESLGTESVLVMELVRGRPLSSVEPGLLDPRRRRTLARTLAHAYFQMFFVDGVFHADPHPGNVMLTEAGEIVLLDFGMVGRVERQVSDGLVRILLAFHLRDGHGVAHAFLDLGKPSSYADENGWVMDVRRILPRYHGKRLERLNVGTLLVDLLSNAARNGIQAPPIVALVCKSLANMDGSARRIDPDVDVTAVFREFLPVLMDAHVKRLSSVEEAVKLAFDVYVGAQRTPAQIGSILEKLATGRLRLVHDAVPRGRRGR